MAKLGGVSTHSAAYSVVNEFEECHSQAMTLTKSLSYVQGCYEGIASSLQAHGHEPTQLMFTDNARAEVKFHEADTPSLKKNVVHVELDKYARLPRLQLPDPSNVSVVVYYESDMIDNACDNLLQ